MENAERFQLSRTSKSWFHHIYLSLFSIQCFPSNHPALWVNMSDGRSRLVSAARSLSASDLLSSHTLSCDRLFPVHHSLLTYLNLWAGPVKSPHYCTNCEDLANCPSWYLENKLFSCLSTGKTSLIYSSFLHGAHTWILLFFFLLHFT